MCVQRFDDSLNSAIRITYRISLRSSSMPEPRDPLLKVLTYFYFFCREGSDCTVDIRVFVCCPPAGNTAVHPAEATTRRVIQAPGGGFGGTSPPRNSVMILPQVHLRKPCYDFYFL
jgi:hypothetical protein